MRRKDYVVKKKTKAKALGFFEYDDIPDAFLPSSGSSSSRESDLENYNPDWFAKSSKIKKKKKGDADTQTNNNDDNLETGSVKGKQKSSKASNAKSRKGQETDEKLKKGTVTRKRKLTQSSSEKVFEVPNRTSKRNKLKGTAVCKDAEVVKDKGSKVKVGDENLKERSVGFSPSQLRSKQTSTPAPGKLHGAQRIHQRKPLTDILSPVPKTKTPPPVCDFNESKNDRFGRSYSRVSFGSLKKQSKRRRKKPTILGVFDSDSESDEEEWVVEAPKKTKRMKLMEQKEARLEKWAAEVNAEFSDIELHELCVESG